MSSHDPNPIFFNNKKKKTGRPEYLLTPHPLHPITSHFCITPPPPPHSPPPTPPHPLPPLKVDAMCVSPLMFICTTTSSPRNVKSMY